MHVYICMYMCTFYIQYICIRNAITVHRLLKICTACEMNCLQEECVHMRTINAQ